MAIRTFNSVGGFSVGEIPANVILANSDITANSATFSGTLVNVSTGNITVPLGNVDTLRLRTDNILHANGDPWDFDNAAGANWQIQYFYDSNLAASANLTFDNTTQVLNVNGNITSLNANLGNLATANYVSGTLTTAEQPNITSLGTLASLAVSGNANIDGNVNAANLNVTAAVISNIIPGTTNSYTLGNSTKMFANMYVGGNIFFASSSAYWYGSSNVVHTDAANVHNNLTAGSLNVTHAATVGEDLTVTGNLTVAGTTTYINVQNLATKDPLILLGGSANGANATAYDGKDRGLILQDYKTDGSAVLNHFFGWKASGSEFVAYANVIDFDNEVVNSSSTLANIHGNALIGNLYGKVETAIQGNITQVGTLANLVIAGNLQVNVNANLASLKAGGLNYPIVDGTDGQHLTTYGNGTLYWKTVDTYKIQNGTSNVEIATEDGNITMTVAGTANVVVVDTGGANITGNLTVSNKITAANISVPNLVIGNSTIKAATITTTSTTANQVIVSIPKTDFTGVEYIIKGVDAAGGKYSIASISAVHDASAVDYAIYGTVGLGGATGSLNVFFNSGTSNIDLRVTPASSNSTVWTTQYRFI